MTGVNTLQAGARVLCFGRGFRRPVVGFRGTALSVYPSTFGLNRQSKLSRQKKILKNRLMAGRKVEMPMEQCYW